MPERYYNPEHLDLYMIAMEYLKGNEVVLDLCCGAGYGADVLMKKGREVWGVDYHVPTIEYAQHYYPKCHFKVLDLNYEPLPFRDDYFDFICWIEGIEHLKTLELILKEIRRVLKKGCFLFLATPPTAEHKVNPDPWHKHEYPLDELVSFFPNVLDLGVKGHGRMSRCLLWKNTK